MAEEAEAEIFKELIHLEMGLGIFKKRNQVLNVFNIYDILLLPKYNDLNYLKSIPFLIEYNIYIKFTHLSI